jgi:2-methylcitrate dehydratase PrpD
MEAVRKLADYVVAARDQALAPEARQAACRCILDLVAATAAGIDAPGSQAVRRTAPAVFASGDHPVWFAGMRTGLAGAAWCNSTAAAALDLDDGNRLARGHPGAAVIPAAIAAAQEVGASTEALLQAIVVGYEVGVTVGAARRFYANTGMWSCYGVVAAVGFLRGTPADQLAHAFAIAGMSAPNQLHVGAGPTQVFPVGSDVKEGIAWSTVTAIHAVFLAEAGSTGPLNLLDGEAHFSLDDFAVLGNRLHICGTYFKFQSCCRHVHAPVDALRGLIDRYGLDPRTIDAVEVYSYSGALRLANPPEPVNFTDIQFSIPYCLGLAALLGSEALLPLTSAALGRADASAFARKVTLVLDPDLDRAFPAQTLTRIVLSCGGRRYESPVTAPRGEASDPPTWDELEDKLRGACRFVAPAEAQSALLAAIRRLRDGDHQPLMRALADLRLGRTQAAP